MSLPRKDQRGVRFVPPERWHITLRFLGDCDEDEAVAALDGVTFPEAHVRLFPAVDVLGERVLVVPASGLDEVAATVIEGTREIGEPPPRRRFVGHLTLARLKPRAEMPRALGVPVDCAFQVQHVALVASRLEPDGARYEIVDEWPVLDG